MYGIRTSRSSGIIDSSNSVLFNELVKKGLNHQSLQNEIVSFVNDLLHWTSWNDPVLFWQHAWLSLMADNITSLTFITTLFLTSVTSYGNSHVAVRGVLYAVFVCWRLVTFSVSLLKPLTWPMTTWKMVEIGELCVQQLLHGCLLITAS